MNKKINLREEVDNIKFVCPNCPGAVFKLETDYINGYGELGCPMCFSSDIRVVFLNHRNVPKDVVKSGHYVKWKPG